MIRRGCFWSSILLEFAVVLSGGRSAEAVSLSFSPPAQAVAASTVSVDILVSGVAAGGPPSVGSFDLDVTFDPTVLSPIGVTFGLFLGDPNLGEAITTFTFTPATIDFSEVSTLSTEDLDSLQPSSFVLATLSFATLAFGESPLTFSQALVVDAFGATLPVTTESGSISKVPEPATLLLLGSGLAAVGIYASRHRRGRR